MADWRTRFRYDPVPSLAASSDLALRYSFERDVLGETDIALTDVWASKPARAILRRQQPDGGWRSTSRSVWKLVDDDQYESFKRLGELVEQYRLDADHPAIRRAAEYFLAHQRAEGDLRGIYGVQYTPNYSAAIVELLVKAGLGADERIIASLDWLNASRQQDGGWALPFRTQGYNLDAFDRTETIEADSDKRSSCMVTGVVLRALAVHPQYGHRPSVRDAAGVLADGMFGVDAYPDRRSADFWTRFAFPFVYTDLLSALDTLSRIGGFTTHPNVERALHWLESHQAPDGQFDIHIVRGNKERQRPWHSLVVCRIYQRLFGR